MQTEIETEAKELMMGASRAVGKDETLTQVTMMPEVQQALNDLIGMHCQNPYSIVCCGFVLGLYMGLQYHDMKKFMGEDKCI